VNHDQVKNLIKNTLKRLGHKYNHNNAVKLLFWTGYVESRYEYTQQLNEAQLKVFGSLNLKVLCLVLKTI